MAGAAPLPSLAMARRVVAVAAVLAVAAVALAHVKAASPAEAAAQRVVTYEVRSLGSHGSDMGVFGDTSVEVLNDPRGWGLDGAVRFEPVPSGGQFTLWLAEASTVPSFSSGCSSTYSCRVGRNVIINEERWRANAQPFAVGGGSLGEYRRYVITHEVGHWIGFGHSGCGGPGQLAPVMSQQSITLGGCRPNGAPLASERSQAAALLGVSLGPPTPTGPPTGNLEAIEATGAPDRVRVAGWAAAPSAGSSAVDVHLYAAGQGWNLGAARQPRPDVAAGLPWAGPDHGFDAVITGMPPGLHRACAFAVVPATAESALIGCHLVIVPALFGNLELAADAGRPGHVRLVGWAVDMSAPQDVADVHVYASTGQAWNLGPVRGTRGDLAPLGARPGTQHGFDVVRTLPAGGDVGFCAYAVSPSGARPIGCRTARLSSTPFGALDLVATSGGGLRVAGWAIDPDTAAAIDVHVYATGGGRTVGWNLGAAADARPDVARVHPAYGCCHGFDERLTGAPGGSVRVCAYAIGVRGGGNALLGCR